MDTEQSEHADDARSSPLGDVPPIYQMSADDTNSPPLPEILPDYHMTAARRVHHSYTLARGTKTWLTFELASRAPSADRLPYFFGHAPITGRVVFDLDKPEFITSIAIEIEGRWTAREMVGRNADSSVTFLQTSTPIWTAPGASAGIMSVLARHEGEKLEGHHVFPFSVRLPETVESAACEQYGMQSFPLPAALAEHGARAGVFSEHVARVSVFYSIGVVVRRGKLSGSNSIHEPFQWVPVIQPLPFSEARQEAYRCGLGDIPSVFEDPDGWETLASIKIMGEAFGRRQVEAEYTLSLSNPLCYTRGSVIPLCLTITCADEQVLDLLSAPNAPAVKLLRNMHYNSRFKGKQRVDASYKPEFRIVQGAVWWIPRNQPASGVRHLMGEIHIAPGLTPALQTPEFRLLYTIGLFAPNVSSLVLTRESVRETGGRRAPLTTREVEIATVYAQDGLRAIAVTPPTYDEAEQWPVSTALSVTS